MYSLGTGKEPRELMSVIEVWRYCCASFWLGKSASRSDLSDDIFSQEVASATGLGAARKLVAGNAWTMKLNTFATQDVDAAFMGKSDLQSKVDTLYAEVNFLKYLFDTVSAVLRRSPWFFPTSHKSVNWRRLISPADSPNWGIPSASVVELVEMWAEQ